MADKTAASYQRLLEYLKNEFQMSAKKFITDFEKSLHCVITIVFPGATHLGCFFHYGQSIIRYVKVKGMQHLYDNDQNFRKSVHMLIVLALLRADQIQTGYEFIKNYLQEKEILEPANPLLAYVISFYVISF